MSISLHGTSELELLLPRRSSSMLCPSTSAQGLLTLFSLLDPAYSEIGPDTCVGMTGGWADYSWVPAIVLVSVMVIFLMDFGAEQYVDRKYGFAHNLTDHHQNVEALITDQPGHDSEVANGRSRSITHNQLHSGDQDDQMHAAIGAAQARKDAPVEKGSDKDDLEKSSQANTEEMQERSFRQQIAAFLILDFGVIFHSVIIGLNLGTAGAEFDTLYPVLVFHQSFEGLGIGARMSAIPFPKRFSWLPWCLCTGYGLTTPIASKFWSNLFPILCEFRSFLPAL
jgi:zinc transporter 1/2/3